MSKPETTECKCVPEGTIGCSCDGTCQCHWESEFEETFKDREYVDGDPEETTEWANGYNQGLSDTRFRIKIFIRTKKAEWEASARESTKRACGCKKCLLELQGN